MRDYKRFDEYYSELMNLDLYTQPMDDGHLKKMVDVISRWIAPIGGGIVLDVGSGYSEAERIFKDVGISYCGMSLAENNKVPSEDFNFIDGENLVDIVFSRHSLEHSPFPLITLWEHR